MPASFASSPRVTWAGSILLMVATLAAFAPALAPNSPTTQFEDRAYAPPARIHIRDANGFRAPFVYRLVLEDRLSRRYREDTASPMTVNWFRGGRLVTTVDGREPVLLLGGDALGRDVFSRLLNGAPLSLGVSLAGVLGALLIGAFLGGIAGTVGGRLDGHVMRIADWLLALPGAYLVLVLRGALPLVISASQVFLLMAGLFAFAAWPHVARGVRAVVAAERSREYAEASRASGAGWWQLMMGLLPAASGFLTVEFVLLVPALLVAEAAISYLGLGFTDPAASWGTMLQDAANVNVLGEAPWLLAPAAGVFLVAVITQAVASTMIDTRPAAR